MAAVPPPIPPFAPASIRNVNRAVILWGALASVVGGVAAFLTTSAAFAVKIESLATDAEVAAQIAEHNAQPRAHGSDYSRSPHPDYAESAAKTDSLAMSMGTLLDNQRADGEASFKMLGSMQVADCERNAKLKAQKANKFRADYDALITNKMPARKAAEQLVSAACPWMSR